jgi:hypothetical protein
VRYYVFLKKIDFHRDEEVESLKGNRLVPRTRSSRRNIGIVASICHVYILPHVCPSSVTFRKQAEG